MKLVVDKYHHSLISSKTKGSYTSPLRYFWWFGWDGGALGLSARSSGLPKWMNSYE